MDIYGFNAPHIPVDLLAAIATSEPRLWIYGMDAVHGAFRLTHLCAVVAFLGPIIVLNLAQLGLIAPLSIQPARTALTRMVRVAFWIAIGSGLGLFVYDPIGAGLHTMFLPKLVLIVVGYLAAQWPPAALRQGSRPLIRRAFASLSLLTWLSVMAASTWNHIEHPVHPGESSSLDEGRETSR